MLRPNKFFLGVIVIAAIAGGGVGWWRVRNGPKQTLRTAKISRGDLVATITASGTLEPEEVVDVGAQVAGLIKSFGKGTNGKTIDYGSIVDEETVLAKIDDSVYAADLAVAKAQIAQDKAGELSAAANLQQLKAKLVQMEAEWKRAEELKRSGLLALSVYDSNKADYEAAKASVAVGEAAMAQAGAASLQAQATLTKAQRNLDFCTIKSPVKGVIIDRRVNIGQTVVSSLNTPSLFLIAKDLTKMQIWVAVNEADIGRIVPGAPVTFTCDAFPSRKFSGTVGKVRLNATMTQNVVMYTVEVDTENPQNILLPYLTANVRFVMQKESDALLVPNAALRWAPSSVDVVVPEARAPKMVASGEGSARETNSKSPKSEKDPKDRSGVVWLKVGELVQPIEVKIGASDGINTAVVGDGLREGSEVVTGEAVESPQAGGSNPFGPQIRKR